MPATHQKVSLLVTVQDEYGDRISEVADRLREAGMSVEGLLDAVGTITGSADTDKVERISRVKGVSHVETSRRFQLPPPESEIQ